MPVERAVEAISELFLVTSSVRCFERLLTVVGLSRSGPVISQCLMWGIRLLTSLPSWGACSAARITTRVSTPPRSTIAIRTVARVAGPRAEAAPA